MKKLIFVFLMVCVVLSLAFASPLQAFASQTGNTVLVMQGRENAERSEIEIDVTVEENTGVCGMLLSLVYDTSVFTLTDIEYGTAFSSLTPIHTNTDTKEGFAIYPFKITYLGEYNDTSTGKMMTLHFSVKDGAEDGSYVINLTHERNKDVTYLNGNEIATKNLLINGAKITLEENKITNIENVSNGNEQNGTSDNYDGLWFPLVIGGAVLVGSCSMFVAIIIKRKKSKKWRKL